MAELNCECCGSRLAFQWSDTHGVGVCVTCGLPYRIFHYEEKDGKQTRVEKPPEVAIRAEWVPVGKRYREETHRRVFPAAFDMGFTGGRRSYSGASQDEAEQFSEWLKLHESELPKPVEAAA